MSTFGFKHSSKNRRSRALSFTRNDELKKGTSFRDEVVGTKKMRHGAVGVKGEAEAWLRGDPVKETEEREWG